MTTAMTGSLECIRRVQAGGLFSWVRRETTRAFDQVVHTRAPGSRPRSQGVHQRNELQQCRRRENRLRRGNRLRRWAVRVRPLTLDRQRRSIRQANDETLPASPQHLELFTFERMMSARDPNPSRCGRRRAPVRSREGASRFRCVICSRMTTSSAPRSSTSSSNGSSPGSGAPPSASSG